MRIITKKISSLFFILLGFTPLLFVLLFSIKQQSIRHHMKERMEKQLLHTITLANTEIQWVKQGKEIWVHGKMFDIKSIEYKNGMTTFHGLYDDDETLLNKNFNEGWKKNMAQQNQLLVQFFQCLQSYYHHPATDFALIPGNQHHLVLLSFPALLSQFKTIPTPPPKPDYSLMFL